MAKNTEPTDRYDEMTDLDLALMSRGGTLGWPYVGPLTAEQTETEAAYERHCEEREAEEEAYLAAGGRSVCPKCGERAVRDRTVVTLGYAGHPEAEHSALYECESCDYRDLG